ncbi:MAG: hypothetical protein QOJ79_3052 [Actinomycetota bacterium]|jgi:hypothetical protein|nr:hypothetical protein [Actinomycetota bacterium]
MSLAAHMLRQPSHWLDTGDRVTQAGAVSQLIVVS